MNEREDEYDIGTTWKKGSGAKPFTMRGLEIQGAIFDPHRPYQPNRLTEDPLTWVHFFVYLPCTLSSAKAQCNRALLRASGCGTLLKEATGPTLWKPRIGAPGNFDFHTTPPTLQTSRKATATPRPRYQKPEPGAPGAAHPAQRTLVYSKNDPFRSWPISANELKEVAMGSETNV
jgi:hypothetical protein